VSLRIQVRLGTSPRPGDRFANCPSYRVGPNRSTRMRSACTPALITTSVAASEKPEEPHMNTVVSASIDAGKSRLESRPAGRGQASGALRV
jgi:hypothetical protein